MAAHLGMADILALAQEEAAVPLTIATNPNW
jgi:hypothetical protein